MVVQRIIGFVAFFTLILIAMGEPIAFLDAPSLLIALGCPLGMLLLGGSNLPVMIKSVLSSNASPEELRAGISGWQQARVYYLAAGIACVLAGVVIVLKNIDNPAAIGPGLAVALLGTLYALILGFGIALPLQAQLEDRAGAPAESGLTSHAALAWVFTVFVVIGTFSILLLPFIGKGSQG